MYCFDCDEIAVPRKDPANGGPIGKEKAHTLFKAHVNSRSHQWKQRTFHIDVSDNIGFTELMKVFSNFGEVEHLDLNDVKDGATLVMKDVRGVRSLCKKSKNLLKIGLQVKYAYEKSSNATEREADSKRELRKRLSAVIHDPNLQLKELVSVMSCDKMEIWLKEFVRDAFVVDLYRYYLPDCKLIPFGSCVSGCGFKNCDMDLCMDLGVSGIDVFSEKRYKKPPKNVSASDLCKSVVVGKLSIGEIIWLLQKPVWHCNSMAYEEVHAVPYARVPVLKMEHRSFHVKFDITISSLCGVENSELIALYSSYSTRVREVLFAVKYWAKINEFIGTSCFSSYAMIMMALFFLMNKELVPTVSALRKLADPSKKKIVGKWNCTFCNDLDRIPKTTNRDSSFTLLQELFDYFGTLEYKETVLCVYAGKLLSLEELNKSATLKDCPIKENCIMVQDPFELDHNLAKAVSETVLDQFKRACTEASQMLKAKQKGSVLNLITTITRKSKENKRKMEDSDSEINDEDSHVAKKPRLTSVVTVKMPDPKPGPSRDMEVVPSEHQRTPKSEKKYRDSLETSPDHRHSRITYSPNKVYSRSSSHDNSHEDDYRHRRHSHEYRSDIGRTSRERKHSENSESENREWRERMRLMEERESNARRKLEQNRCPPSMAMFTPPRMPKPGPYYIGPPVSSSTSAEAMADAVMKLGRMQSNNYSGSYGRDSGRGRGYRGGYERGFRGRNDRFYRYVRPVRPALPPPVPVYDKGLVLSFQPVCLRRGYHWRDLHWHQQLFHFNWQAMEEIYRLLSGALMIHCELVWGHACGAHVMMVNVNRQCDMMDGRPTSRHKFEYKGERLEDGEVEECSVEDTVCDVMVDILATIEGRRCPSDFVQSNNDIVLRAQSRHDPFNFRKRFRKEHFGRYADAFMNVERERALTKKTVEAQPEAPGGKRLFFVSVVFPHKPDQLFTVNLVPMAPQHQQVHPALLTMLDLTREYLCKKLKMKGLLMNPFYRQGFQSTTAIDPTIPVIMD